MTTRSERHEEKKMEIIEFMKQYKDENGNVDLSRLRKEEPKVYAKIPYYFGSIDQAVIELLTDSSEEIKLSAKGATINRKTMRNQLAFDMLNILREKYTLEEIGKMYGVSRAHVNQLYQSLAKSLGVTKENKKENNNETTA